jgi:hypothetical protein
MEFLQHKKAYCLAKKGELMRRRHSMIKRLFCLSVVMHCCFFVFGASGVDDENVIILDDSSWSGDVFIFQVSSGSPIQKELAKNVSRFAIARSGHFVLKDKDGNWFKGRVDASLTVAKRAIKSVPLDVTRAAISEDGKRIAWVNTALPKSELIVEGYDGDKPTVLRVISKNGLIAAPAWSPDGNLLAYYYGPPGAETKDGFILMLLDVSSAGNQPVPITPPSRWTRPTPLRGSPPLWSPDGKFLRFEGRYDDDLSKCSYIVSVDGKQLRPATFGWWDQEGKLGYGLKQEDQGLNEFIITEEDALQKGQKKSFSIKHRIKLTGSRGIVAISPSARKVAYIENDKEALLFDSETGKTVSLDSRIVNALTRLIWINPTGR